MVSDQSTRVTAFALKSAMASYVVRYIEVQAPTKKTDRDSWFDEVVEEWATQSKMPLIGVKKLTQNGHPARELVIRDLYFEGRAILVDQRLYFLTVSWPRQLLLPESMKEKVAAKFFDSFKAIKTASPAPQAGLTESVRKEMFAELDKGFLEVSRKAFDPEGIFKSVMYDYLNEDSIPTPEVPSLSNAGRFSKSEVEAFARSHRSFMKAYNNKELHKMRSDLSLLFLPLLESRLEKISRAAGKNPNHPLRIIVDRQNVDTLGVRKSATGNEYLILIGADFLNRLNNSVLTLAAYLFRAYSLNNTGFNTEGLLIDDLISVADYVDLAPQLHPQNLARRATVDGFVRSKMDMMVAPISSVRLLKVKAVPEDIKKAITTSPVGVGFVPTENIDFSSALSLYLSDNSYITAAHYYLLRDVLSYLISHELAHALRDEESSDISTLKSEITADEEAIRILKSLKDTDLRALYLAMSSFVSEMDYQKEEDADHPFAAQRLILLGSSLEALQPNLFLDLDAGLNLVRQPLPLVSDLSRLDFSYGLDHSIRFHATWDKQELFNNYHGLSVDLTVDLYSLTAPSTSVAQAHFTGELRSILNQEDRTAGQPKSKAYMIFQCDLPPDLWAKCPECGVRLTNFSLFNGEPKGWQIAQTDAAAMKDKLLNYSAEQRGYQLLFLARGLYRQARYPEAKEIYALLAQDWKNLLAPADWVKWASATPKESVVERAQILEQAVQGFPKTEGLSYVAGVMRESAGNHLRAIDHYFNEMYGIPISTHKDDASQRMMSLLVKADKNDLAAPFYEAFKYYLAAQYVGKSDLEQKDKVQISIDFYGRAAKMFGDISHASESFAARVYQAETMMYQFQLAKKPLGPVKDLFTELTMTKPSFIPSYVHLFSISYCEKETETAKKWLISAIRQDPLRIHELLAPAIPLLDKKWDPKVCTIK